MKFRVQLVLSTATGIFFFFTTVALAQEDTTSKKLLRSPAVVKGFIGGESHDSYVIQVHKNKTLIVQISWQRKGDNHADFTISESPNFFTADEVKFGQHSGHGKRWTGKIPMTGTYYIYVVARPEARYTLSVSTK